MINMYYYVLKKAHMEARQPRIRFLSKALHHPSKARQFHFLRIWKAGSKRCDDDFVH